MGGFLYGLYFRNVTGGMRQALAHIGQAAFILTIVGAGFVFFHTKNIHQLNASVFFAGFTAVFSVSFSPREWRN